VGNRHRRAELRAQADEQTRLDAIAAPRHVDVELHYRGVGFALLRLAVLRSFEPAVLWEVYGRADALFVSVSRGTEPDTSYVTGQTSLDADPAVLRGLLDELCGHSFALAPAEPKSLILDGTRFIATVNIGQAACRLEWVEGDVPSAWSGTIAHLLKVHRYLASLAAAA
jgi:hypothetical protein